MLDRVPSRADKLRQQLISQSEGRRGDRKMSNDNNEEIKNRVNAVEDASDDAALNAELREAMQETLRRERQNEANQGANNMADQNDNREDIDQDEEALEQETPEGSTAEAEDLEELTEEEGDLEEEAATPTITELFAGERSVRLRIAPRIMLNVAANAAGDVPDVVRIGDQFYSVASPLRKSKGKQIGSKSNPHGLIRDSIGDLATFIGNMRDNDVLLFGATSDLEDRVADLMDYLDGEARGIMYGVFEEFKNERTPLFSFRAPSREDEVEDVEEVEEEDESDLDNVGVTEVSATSDVPQTVTSPASDSFTVHTWPVFDSDEDGTIILRPTIAININVPLLLSASDIVKPLASMSKIVANYARAAGLDDDDFRVTYAFDSADLLDESLLNLLQAHAAEDSESVIISGTYLDRCVVDHNNDVYRVFPTGRTVREARSLLLSNGGDTLLLL